MKLTTFQKSGADRLGVVTKSGLIDLAKYDPKNPYFASMQALIDGGDEALKHAQSAVDTVSEWLEVESITMRPPLPRPVQIRDCLCFEEHLLNSYKVGLKVTAMKANDPEAEEKKLQESGRFDIPDIWYKQPLYYKANRFAVGVNGQDIVWPNYSNLMDFELEMACIIGKKGKDISKETADDYIFGYTIYNDLSARDAQMEEIQGLLGPAKGKDFDSSIILGPVIVTKDELANPYNLYMRARVNGETWCDNNSSTMHWKFPDMIAHISQGETLYPGEVIGSGTVGWGCGLEHMRFLKDGDVVELEIEGIGSIKNRVVRNSY